MISAGPAGTAYICHRCAHQTAWPARRTTLPSAPRASDPLGPGRPVYATLRRRIPCVLQTADAESVPRDRNATPLATSPSGVGQFITVTNHLGPSPSRRPTNQDATVSAPRIARAASGSAPLDRCGRRLSPLGITDHHSSWGHPYVTVTDCRLLAVPITFPHNVFRTYQVLRSGPRERPASRCQTTSPRRTSTVMS